MYAILKNERLEDNTFTKEKLIAELRELNSQISAVNREFNLVTDDNLIDSLIYQMLALTERQQFLIKSLKEMLTEEKTNDKTQIQTQTNNVTDKELPSGA